ncbi:MAG: FecR family protein [Agriterribacter sp.]
MQEKLAILLSRKLSGEATLAELEELEDWVKSNPNDQYVIDIVQSYWHNNPAEHFPDVSANTHFERVLNKAEARRENSARQTGLAKIRRHIKWVAAAAVFSGFIIIATIFLNQRNTFSFNRNSEVTTSLGTRSHLILPDGTKVWLNAGTLIRFDKQFNSTLREVYLDGEAFFDVKKDTKRPFIVHTSDIDIRVLGTAFNVKSYKDEATIETTLLHGSIEVNNVSEKNVPRLILKPNEKLVFTKVPDGNIKTPPSAAKSIEKAAPLYAVSKVLPAKNDSSLIETSWIHNRLLFDGGTFGELAVKMERWFNVEIKFENADVAGYRLRGVFEDESIDEALKALQQIADFKYTIKDKTITIAK